MTLRVLDLFSGIGGFSLGLERTGGFKTVAFCEIEPFCRKVLAKHWPGVPCYDDVRELTAERLAADGIGVDVVCGGFPCQDISVAGKGAGLEGERSGLWFEYARIIGELRPAFVIVENVAALLSRGLDRVLGDLASLGFDAEWHCVPASAVGAPHRRDRVWIIAHPISRKLRHESRWRNGESWTREAIPSDNGAEGIVAHPERAQWWPDTASCRPIQWQDSISPRQEGANRFGPSCEALADATKLLSNGSSVHGGSNSESSDTLSQSGNLCSASADTDISRLEGWRLSQRIREALTAVDRDGWWTTEPNVGRVAHGIPSRVDRLKGLGNAVVPQIPEAIGNAILASLKQTEAA